MPDGYIMQNQTVVITGAGGGLGAALCRRFGKEGASIAALDIDATALSKLSKELTVSGVNHQIYQCDVTSEVECQAVIQQVEKDMGGIKILINNAGVAHRSAFVRTKPAVLRKIIEISLFGTIYCTSAAMPSLMNNRGTIVGISSIAGFGPLCGRTGYAAAKHGMAGFLNTLRTEVDGDGLSVMIVYANYIATNIDNNALDGEGNINQNEKVISGTILMPDDAAESIYQAVINQERQILLGDNAQAAWDLYHSDPIMFEQIMMANNRYILEQ